MPYFKFAHAVNVIVRALIPIFGVAFLGWSGAKLLAVYFADTLASFYSVASLASYAATTMSTQYQAWMKDGLTPGKGQGGIGSGGGKGSGSGTGEGIGVGSGKSKLNDREKRMLRWHMRFTANSGQEYLDQLRGLGAILAVPVVERPEPQYKVIRNLTPPSLASERMGWCVLRVLVPGLQPLHGHHALPFLGGPLWLPRTWKEWADMPPHPFP